MERCTVKAEKLPFGVTIVVFGVDNLEVLVSNQRYCGLFQPFLHNLPPAKKRVDADMSHENSSGYPGTSIVIPIKDEDENMSAVKDQLLKYFMLCLFNKLFYEISTRHSLFNLIFNISIYFAQ